MYRLPARAYSSAQNFFIMEETLLQSEAFVLAQKNMLDYFQTHDPKYVADDGVF
jgi:hypothetical protein